MRDIFNSLIKFNDNAKRNIVYVSKPADAFSSITDSDEERDIINLTSDLARMQVARNNEMSDFYYSAAIGYPFQTKPYMKTRYSDGTYPVWYGSLSIETSIYETIYHTVNFLLAENNATAFIEKIIKKRSVFDVFCDAFLIDLTEKINDHPEIVSDNYEFTHKIGSLIHQGDLPGLVSPSRRHLGGKNLSIFKQSVLKNPVLLCNLRYEIFPATKTAKIFGLGEDLEISF
jgi:hypothetical protein